MPVRFFLRIRPRPRSTLFPYTTLFRSCGAIGSKSGARHSLGQLDSEPLLGERPPGRSPSGRLMTLGVPPDRKSTRLNSSHSQTSYAVSSLKKKTYTRRPPTDQPTPAPD